MMRTSTTFFIAASLALASGMALSQTEPQGAQSAYPNPMPSQEQPAASAQADADSAFIGIKPKTENGITYMCGGVGIDEAQYMKQAARDYNLMLTFSTREGNYLADVDVTITDAKANPVLKTTCDGSIMLVDLPKSGVYQVQAQAGDFKLNRTAKVKAKGHTSSVVLAWPQEPAAMAGIAREKSGGETSSGGN